MEFINAIAKARFSSARAQRIHLRTDDHLTVDLLCLEPGQEAEVRSGEWTYYVVTGTAALTSKGEVTDLPTGQLAVTEADEPHTLAAAGERRLVCLAVGRD